jgi:hypothetical protein
MVVIIWLLQLKIAPLLEGCLKCNNRVTHNQQDCIYAQIDPAYIVAGAQLWPKI